MTTAILDNLEQVILTEIDSEITCTCFGCYFEFDRPCKRKCFNDKIYVYEKSVTFKPSIFNYIEI